MYACLCVYTYIIYIYILREREGERERERNASNCIGINRAPRNHFLEWIVKSSGCHCTDGHLTGRVFAEDQQIRYIILDKAYICTFKCTPGLHNKIPAHKIFARVWVAQESIVLHYQR